MVESDFQASRVAAPHDGRITPLADQIEVITLAPMRERSGAIGVPIDRTVTIGLTLYLAGAAALVVLLFAGVRHPGAVLVPMALFQFGNGIVMPNTVAGAMAPFPQAAGSASALAGFVQMATGALSGLVLGRLHDGSARPMTVLVVVSAVSAALFFALPIRRRHGRPSRSTSHG